MHPEDEDSGSAWKLVAHFIAELSWRMVVAAGFVAFFFFYGATNALIKLTGRNLASFDFPAGPLFGLLGAGGLLIMVIIIKLQSRD
ncbi:MAG: hypothetical protein K9N01_13130 [Cephaloticoccus sp.]|nr:hypothetical protein [Cephaloticoccus sp.]